MKLISKVHISRFRSIKEAEVKDISDFTVVSGLNNSGKSNFLRALNAFFTGQTDAGVSLNVDADFYRPDLRRKTKKQIKIGVSFELPAYFKFRQGLHAVEKLLASRNFRIEKEWFRDQLKPTYFLDGRSIESRDEELRIDQFLQMINFRYIPNRVLPTDVIKQEHRALRDVLIRRLGKKSRGDLAAFDAIQKASADLISSVSKRFKDATHEGDDLKLATPKSWRDIAFSFGYRLLQDGIEIEDSAQGSGIQSLLMLETLLLIDQDYYQQFGWRQAAIWAVEEPESSLHTSLEARVGSFLRKISHADNSRLQILSTTHSDLMIQNADKIIAAERVAQPKIHTELKELGEAREAMKYLSKIGASRWVHPILHYPLDPLLIVEGKHDRIFFEKILQLYNVTPSVRVVDLELLHGSGKSGGDSEVVNYINNCVHEIKTRQTAAPVVVVLDWDSAGKINSMQKHFDSKDPFSSLAWPDSVLNQKISKRVKGIERTYCDRLITRAIELEAKIFRDGAKWIFDPDSIEETKSKLASIVNSELTLPDLVNCQSFIGDIFTRLGVVPAQQTI